MRLIEAVLKTSDINGEHQMSKVHGGLLGLVVLGTVGLPLRADDDFKPEPGYTSLFNGKDLTGWRYAGSKEVLEGKTETGDKRFEVVNGVIVANEKDAKGKGGIRDLYTIRDFNKDFHLKMEFRASLKSDSGVYIRGPQLQVRDFIRRNEQKQLKKFKNDDWNELDITVKNGVITTNVNGKALTDKDVLEMTVKDGKPEAKLNGKEVEIKSIQVAINAVATCLCNGEALSPKTMNIPMKSTQGIGLQAETGKFEFRRIRFKELP
jgi:hypothetical protein